MLGCIRNYLTSLVFAEFQESHEQCFPPAEDDGDPAHEQRLSRHLAATSAGVSTGCKQRWVRFQMHNYALGLYFVFWFKNKNQQAKLINITTFFKRLCFVSSLNIGHCS